MCDPHPSSSFTPISDKLPEEETQQTEKHEPSAHMNENHARVSPALIETIAGLSAGTISTLTVHPLDVIKTRLQIHRSTSATPVNSLSIFRSLTQNPHPVQNLYRGLTPNLIGNASSWALFFLFKNLAEEQLFRFHNRHDSSASYAASTSLNHNGNINSHEGIPRRHLLTPADYFLASGVSGIMITLLTNPIWVLKTRMLSSDRASRGAYPSTWQGVQRIWAIEGAGGFYRGVGISLVGNCHGAVQFAVYEPLKRFWWGILAAREKAQVHRLGLQHKPIHEEEEKLSNTATLVISASAKIVAGSATYPYQVIRSRLQTYDSEMRFGRGISGVANKIWREEGLRGFYRGLGTNIVRVLPATWVTFLVYENMRYYLPLWNK